MAVEVLIKRTLYVSKCKDCGDRVEKTDRPPRERQCPCGKWVPYIETSFTGPRIGV